MEQHPIPQQISSYQFRLVGDMTLKQFFQVAAGALSSLLIYATALHPVIKWPLILFFFSLGLALAFLPFEERPLSQWILSFFRSVYSPTVHLWTEPKSKYQFFKEDVVMDKKEDPYVIAPHGEVKLNEYLTSTPNEAQESTKSLEKTEIGFLEKIKSLLSRPDLLEKTEEAKSLPQKPEGIQIPTIKPISIVQPSNIRPKFVVEERPVVDVNELFKRSEATKLEPTLKSSDTSKGALAQFSTNAAPPLPPTMPNTIVGQVMDPEGKIIDGAILEIRDMAGRPVRALRSNKVGHFIIVTTLQNGFYEIIPEKEGFIFEPVSFEAKGEIIPPIAIRAKSVNN